MDILKRILEQLELIFQLSKQIFDMVNQTQFKDTTDVHDDYLSMYQASVVYRVSERQIYRWKKANLITTTYIGSTPFFNKATLAKEIKDNKLDMRKRSGRRKD